MTTSLRGTMSGGNDGSSSSLGAATLVLPAGLAVGDVAIALESEATGSNTISGGGIPSGYTTKDGPTTNSTSIRSYVFAKDVASTGESGGNCLATWSGSGRALASGIVAAGTTGIADMVVGTAIANSSGPISSMTAPTVTTPGDGYEVYMLAIGRVGSGTPGDINFPAGWTRVTQHKLATTGANHVHAIARLNTPGAAGSYGGGSMGPASGTFTNMNVHILALKPTPDADPHVWFIYNGTEWVGADVVIL